MNKRNVLMGVVWCLFIAAVVFAMNGAWQAQQAQYGLDVAQEWAIEGLQNNVSSTVDWMANLDQEVEYLRRDVSGLQDRVTAIDGGNVKVWSCEYKNYCEFNADGSTGSSCVHPTAMLWTIGRETPAQMAPGATCVATTTRNFGEKIIVSTGTLE